MTYYINRIPKVNPSKKKSVDALVINNKITIILVMVDNTAQHTDNDKRPLIVFVIDGHYAPMNSN